MYVTKNSLSNMKLKNTETGSHPRTNILKNSHWNGIYCVVGILFQFVTFVQCVHFKKSTWEFRISRVLARISIWTHHTFPSVTPEVQETWWWKGWWYIAHGRHRRWQTESKDHDKGDGPDDKLLGSAAGDSNSKQRITGTQVIQI